MDQKELKMSEQDDRECDTNTVLSERERRRVVRIRNLTLTVLPTLALLAVAYFSSRRIELQADSLAPQIINIAISIFACAIFCILRGKWINPVLETLGYTRAPVEAETTKFARFVFGLLALHAFGELIIHSCLLYRVEFPHKGALDWPPGLILLGDLLGILYLWTWIVVFRGTAAHLEEKRATVTQILCACGVVISLDLFLCFQYLPEGVKRPWNLENRPWELMPSAILNALILAAAVGASAYRYRWRGGPLVVAFVTYSVTQIPAYQRVLFHQQAPELWVYYALGLCDLVIALLICDLLLGRAERSGGTMRSLFGPERLVAVMALLIVVFEQWEKLQDFVNFTAVTLAAPCVAVILAFRQKKPEHTSS